MTPKTVGIICRIRLRVKRSITSNHRTCASMRGGWLPVDGVVLDHAVGEIVGLVVPHPGVVQAVAQRGGVEDPGAVLDDDVRHLGVERGPFRAVLHHPHPLVERVELLVHVVRMVGAGRGCSGRRRAGGSSPRPGSPPPSPAGTSGPGAGPSCRGRSASCCSWASGRIPISSMNELSSSMAWRISAFSADAQFEGELQAPPGRRVDAVRGTRPPPAGAAPARGRRRTAFGRST